jgi:hypothetical protein
MDRRFWPKRTMAREAVVRANMVTMMMRMVLRLRVAMSCVCGCVCVCVSESSLRQSSSCLLLFGVSFTGYTSTQISLPILLYYRYY